MTSDRFAEINRLFNLILENEVEDRPIMLDAIRVEDPELCGEIEKLLQQSTGTWDVCLPKAVDVEHGRLDSTDSTNSLNQFDAGSFPRNAPQLNPGEVLGGRFTIVQFLARGGMGEVYEAADNHLQNRRCALKTLRREIAADPALQKRFEREVLLAREVIHPNVCPTYDIFRVEESGGTLLFLTMKLLRGESLAERLNRTGRLDLETTLAIAQQMAAALDAAHRAGIAHRDFKPGNVMIEGAAKDLRISLTDFGLSRLYDSDSALAQTGKLSGTPGYIAPEVLQGHTALPVADVYAFGVVLHLMLTGQKPQNKPGKAEFVAPSSLVDGLPKAWDRVVIGCLEFNPALRFQSAGEALAVLKGSSTANVGLPPPSSRIPLVRRRLTYWLLAGALASLASLALFFPQVEDLVRPLPARRFVALRAAPDSAPQQAALLGSILNGIHDRLVRAEARVQDLLIIGPTELGQQKDDPQTMGSNLTLTVSVEGSSANARLQLVDPATRKILRRANVPIDRSQPGVAPEAAAAAAARMLRIPPARERLTDEYERAALPASVYQVFTAAEELRRQPNDVGLEASIEKFQLVLESAPRFALGYARISEAYIRKYQIAHDPAALAVAARNAELAVRRNPESPSAKLSEALVYLYSGRTVQALEELANVLRLDPDNPEVLLYQATAYRDLNRLSDEENTCRRLILQRPNFHRAYNALGMSLFRQGRYAESVAAFQQAIQIAPRQSLPYSNLGLAYFLLGRRQDAADAFHASIERGPSELAWLNLGNISFEDKDYRKALENYQKARDLKPSDDLAWRNVADCYAVLGNRKSMLENYAKAADVLGDLLRTNSKRGSAWMTMAFYQAKLGNKVGAENALKSAESNGASSVQAQFTKAQALALLGRKAEAITVLADCVRRGLSPVEIQLALDLKDIREDPAWLRQFGNTSASNKEDSNRKGKGKTK
jgi:tetratricopeptide (TPR) repeat protein/tRNA A-37 threonylcarbamoyl transferase component Bud32